MAAALHNTAHATRFSTRLTAQFLHIITKPVAIGVMVGTGAAILTQHLSTAHVPLSGYLGVDTSVGVSVTSGICAGILAGGAAAAADHCLKPYFDSKNYWAQTTFTAAKLSAAILAVAIGYAAGRA